MKKIIFVISVVVGLYGTSFGMLASRQGHGDEVTDVPVSLSFRNTRGERVIVPITAMREGDFLRTMTEEGVNALIDFVAYFNQFIEIHQQGSGRDESSISEINASIANYEQSFLGMDKDTQTLTVGYQALKTKFRDPEFIGKLDGNLGAIYEQAKEKTLCRTLAEFYKGKARITRVPDDYIKAAFWYRMLHVTGAHSDSLTEYDDMIHRSGL